MTVATGASLEHEIGAEGLLAIRIRDGEVRLRGVDGGTVRVREVNGRHLDEIFAIEAAAGSLSLKSGRTLEIVVGPRVMRRGLGGHNPELEIEVPRRATLVLEAASGDVAAAGLLGDQRYRTASGDVSLRAVGGRLSVEVVSGDVDLQATGEAAVTVRSMSGDIGVRAETLTALQVNTTSGDIGVTGRLAGPGPFAIETVSGDGLLAPVGDVRIEMTSLTGDLSSDLDGRQASEHGRRSLSIGSHGPLVTFQSLSGDLHVARSLPDRPADASEVLDAAVPDGVAASQPTATAANGAIAAAYEAARLRILRSLERGEIDVAEAGRRLETLDAGDVQWPADQPVPGRDDSSDA
jgi:hypothetical protein